MTPHHFGEIRPRLSGLSNNQKESRTGSKDDRSDEEADLSSSCTMNIWRSKEAVARCAM
jgi:hypothetical protein